MIKVRIAPSPTGDPHVGTAYSALFNYAFARHNRGAFILRIEDTDRTRSTPESEVAILESLRWLGLDWDEGPVTGGPNGPYRQSERTAIYREHVDRLVRDGAAYPCFCTAERLAEMRKNRKPGDPVGYDGLCKGLSQAEVEANMAKGLPHVIRLKVDKAAATSFEDLARGQITIENMNVDDQVLLKSDGFPTYHLANVVDDHLMGITHVIRAEEWISSTPKHVILYRAFGWDQPVFIHLPLLRNKDRSKISKRKNPTSILYYREKGYLPEALLNFLALMGWSTSDEEEVFDLDRMVSEMDPKDLHIGGPVFDLDKLDWINGVYIRNLSPDALAGRLEQGFLGGREISRDRLLKIIPLVQERLKTLSDFAAITDYLFEVKPVTFDDFKKVKNKDSHEIAAMLSEAASAIEEAGTLDTDTLDPIIRELAEKMEVKAGALFMALRVAVTGSNVSPPLLESMEVLGLDECLARIRTAANALSE